MDIIDSIALWARRYEPQTVPSSGQTRFSLADVLQMFDRAAVLELVASAGSRAGEVVRPDPVRKVKVSLLDNGISAIHSSSGDWYQVYRTAPSGDYSKVRIVANSPEGAKLGEIKMLVGRRTYDQYYAEDPIFAEIARARAR